jgi:murein DD-endopeptidase MepM/ murein hydrolase activator NlpD
MVAHFVTYKMRNSRSKAVLGTLVLTLIAASCGGGGEHAEFAGYTPHERYEHGLRSAGLDVTALGRDWLAASRRALEAPVTISAPYNEVSYMDAGEAGAVGYRVNLVRGQTVTVSFELDGDTAYQVFLDMFVMPTGARTAPILLTSADTNSNQLEYVARRDGDYIVRVQPELLRGGRYSITVEVGGSLGFPVAGHDHASVRSFWGDWRSGGRIHQGVDIFAPRGTPVLAATKGTVRSTRPNNLGGKVVFLRDELGRSQYYAHLDSQVVARGDRVEAGDTLGFVGNTGNARTTPPHLHFGITSRGWFDPLPALAPPSPPAAEFAGDQNVVGSIVRASADRTRIRVLPASRSSAVASLDRHTPLSVVAGSGRWYRVSLPDGAVGFVEARFVESVDEPIRSELVATGALLRTSPMPSAAATDSLVAGQQVPVLGAFGEFLLVQAPSGRAGWLVLD